MIAKGSWKGQYKYDDKSIQNVIGFEQTNFEIEIISTNDESFTGTVQDDLTTGGTRGVGEIIGKVNGMRVEFVKQMPIMSLIVNKRGTRKILNQKHRKIYYIGSLSDDGKRVSGRWKFKFGFIWTGMLPRIGLPTKGTWTMSRAE